MEAHSNNQVEPPKTPTRFGAAALRLGGIVFDLLVLLLHLGVRGLQLQVLHPQLIQLLLDGLDLKVRKKHMAVGQKWVPKMEPW